MGARSAPKEGALASFLGASTDAFDLRGQFFLESHSRTSILSGGRPIAHAKHIALLLTVVEGCDLLKNTGAKLSRILRLHSAVRHLPKPPS